ncbi:MAG: hypothetical protein ACFB8W_14325 [Elainellaceae cyanobacterium]
MSTQAELDQAVLFDRLQHTLHRLYDAVTHRLPVFPRAEQAFESFTSPDGDKC